MKNFLCNKKNIGEKISVLISVIISIICVLPVVIASGYTVLAADDIANAYEIGFGSNNLGEYVLDSFKFAKRMYMGWQGTYFSLFLQALLSPMNNFGMPQLRIIMVFNSLLFYGALFFLTWSIMRCFKCEKCFKWTLFIYACLAYMLTSYEDYVQIFFWYTGAASYTIPLSLLLIALGGAILYQQNKGRKYFYIAVILGFFAMGGNLMISGMGCYMCLLLCFYMYLRERKLDKQNVIIFVTWIAGALLNVAAPGNYIRHGVIDETGYYPILALKVTVAEYIKHVRWYCNNTDLIGILGIILLLGIICKKTIGLSYMVVALLGLILPAITVFPVVLGYSGRTLPERCGFMIQLAIILSFTNIAFVIGNYIGMIINKVNVVKAFTILLGLGIVILLNVDNYKLESSIALSHWNSLKQGTYREYYNECEKLFASLENRQGEDVVIREEEMPERVPNIGSIDISRYPNDWVNIALSKCYGLSSISIVSQE